MLKLPKCTKISKYGQPHNIIPPKSGVRFSSQPPALPDDLLEHCDPKPWRNTIRYQDPPLPIRCQKNSPKPKPAKNRVPTSRASQSQEILASAVPARLLTGCQRQRAEGDVPDRTEKHRNIPFKIKETLWTGLKMPPEKKV